MSRVNVDKVKKLLEELRDDPTLFTIDDRVLQPIWEYLVSVPLVGGERHWFCTLANDTTIEAATFLLRLLSFSSVAVIKWKELLHECLSHCVGCVHGCEAAKIRSRSTYLSNYMSETLDAFFLSVDELELTQVLGDIDSASKTGASVHDAVLYRMITNWHIFADRVVLDYLYAYPPTSVTDGWPQPLGPGLLVLLISDNASLRQWALGHASRSRIIGPNDFNRSHNMALSLVLWALKGSPGQAPVTVPPPMATKSQLWSGVYDILRLLPPKWFQTDIGLEMKRMVLSKLNTPEPEFQSIFKSFILLSKRLGADLWSGEGPEYPGGIFDAIVHNRYYSTQLQTLGQPDAGSFYLSWFQEYLATLRSSLNYGAILNKVIRFFCEDAQTESFEQVRPTVMKLALSILKSEFKRSSTNDSGVNCRKIVSDILDLHANAFLDLAFSNKYKSTQWQSTRELARSFLEETIHDDIDSIREVIKKMPPILGQRKVDQAKEVTLPVLSFRKKIWPALYTSLQTNITLDAQDVKAIGSMISLVAKVSHLAKLQKSVYTDSWGDLPAGNALLEEVNQCLSAIHDGFSAVVSTFSECGNSANGIDLLQSDGVSKAVMMLLLSPIQEFETASKTLIGLAFDVDGRADCIRAMLENLPVQSFDGMFEFLERFEKYATVMPEACTLSATLVLCFADVLEVMCATPGGLIHSSYFLRPNEDTGPAARLPQFWKRLNAALTVIYKRTPMWAEVMEATAMVTWMRDAMILARDALSQWRVIEHASNTYNKVAEKQSKSVKVSAIGKQMINSLQTFMPEVVKWLRLTNEELLYQSFSLLESLLDLMKETDIQPMEIVLTKCLKYVRGKSSTKLDEGRLSRLSEKLAYFEEDDIEIVEHKPAPEKPVASSSKIAPSTVPPRPTPPALVSSTASAKGKATVEEPPQGRNYIQGRTSVSAGTASKIKLQKPLPFKSSAIVYDSDDDKTSSKPSKFTEKDKQRLAAATAATRPSFRKTSSSSTGSVSGPSKPSDAGLRVPRNSGESKNESHSAASLSEATESNASDPESDDDDMPDLANYGKVKSPSKPKPVVRRQIKTMDLPTRTASGPRRPKEKNWAEFQSERIKPDISALHKIILSWKYDYDGPLPPGPPLVPCRVPQQFKDYDQYFRVFQPLLLFESWAQLSKSKEETQESFQCKVESRHYNSDFAEIDMTIPESVTAGWYLAETDIVLLRQPGNPKCAMAKVRRYRSSKAGIQFTVGCYCPGGSGDPGLHISTLWQISKLFSLSTLNREYAALVSLQYNRMQSFIFNPSLPQTREVDPKALPQVMQKHKLNEPQAVAILKALDTDGFSLIQGPPGTGKTSTITGLISRFLSKKSSAPVQITAGRTSGEAPPPRVLVCAPSNAAVNELVQRLQDANIHAAQRGKTASIVRIGTEDAVSDNVRDLFLENLVQEKLGGVVRPPFGDIANEISGIYQELAAVKAQRITIQQELDTSTGPRQSFLQNQKRELFAKKEVLGSKLDKTRAKQKDESRTFDTARRNARLEVLNGADIICTTLSGAGHENIDMLSFDMIVIDEAAQSIELSSLIPLRFGCSRVVMVGDPQQLPPTVISREAMQYGYNESLFVRLQRSRPDAVHLLSIQYRMHPDISCLPSRVFYNDKLLDGPDMATKTLQPWHATKQFGTYKFFNVAGVEESVGGHSLKNTAECVIATEIFRALSQHYKSIDFSGRVGIISMYRAQNTALRNTFTNKFGRDVASKIQFGTVDGFQGQEKDIIILSCVRSGTRSSNIGFLTDMRRMNVALTRAKSSLFILGNAPTLERSDKTWAEIVKDAKTRSTLINANAQYFARPPSPENIDINQSPMKKRKFGAKPDTQPPMPDLLNPSDLKSADVGSSAISAKPVTSNKPKQVSASPVLPSVSKPDPATQPDRTSGKRGNGDGTSAGATPVSASVRREPTTVEGTGPSAGPSTDRNPTTSSTPVQQPRPAPPKKRKNPPAMDMFIPKKKK